MQRRFLLTALFFSIVLLSACRESGPAPAPAEGTPEVPKKGANAPSDSAFLGLTEKEGADRAEADGLRHRVISVDGQPRPATKDYRPDRVNFEIVNGRITAVTRG
jgi:hypothetical protein